MLRVLSRPIWRIALLTQLAALLGACAAVDPNHWAKALAQPAGLARQEITTTPFVLTAFVRITRSDRPLTVYIEGDGLAWRNRHQPSDDPTPRQAIGLALAAVDPAPNVVYLARPCQFTPMTLNPSCAAAYWTNKRYATEVIDSINQAVEHFMSQLPGQGLNLVGYSGGGAVAVLLAARRSDVASIRTVAGNLDHVEVNRLHGVSPMPESENAIDLARQVASIAQIHFSGGNDRVVPPSIAQRFVSAGGGSCAEARVIPGMSHQGEWSALWPTLLAIPPHCSARL